MNLSRTRALLRPFPLVITLLATTLSAQSLIERGVLYRSDDPAFEIWIPRGLSQSRQHAEEGEKQYDAIFLGSAAGLFQVAFASEAVDSLTDYVEGTRRGAESTFPGCEVDVHEGEKAAGHPAVIMVFTKLAAKPRYTSDASIRAGVMLTSGEVLSLGAYCDKARLDQALARVRWMLSTLRSTRPDAIDRELAPRRLDQATGLSYRLPRAVRAAPAATATAAVVTARAANAGYELSVTSTTENDPGKLLREQSAGLTRMGAPWSLPGEDGRRLTCALFRGDPDKALAVVVAALEGNSRFVIRAEGPFATREVMVRAMERMALSLRFVDVPAARAEVAVAIATLEEARKKRNKAEIAAQVKILARHAYLDEAAGALIGSLRALDNPAARIQAAAALTACDDADLVPDLLKAVRLAKSRRQDALLVELLGALGTIRGEKAVSVLLDFARRGTAAQSAAAVRSLGRYEVKRDRVVKGLIKAMARAEADARKNDFSARERWITLGPAFRHALEQLTGQSFQTADAAKEWLRTR